MAYRVKDIHSLVLCRKTLLTHGLNLSSFDIQQSLECGATVHFANEMQGETSDL